jgi:hypothetical protein
MDHWLTTHWAQLKGHPYEPYVYVKDNQRSLYQMRSGDRVLVYESKGGPTAFDEHGKRLTRQRGASGITCAVEITASGLRERPAYDQNLKIVGHPDANFKWQATTKPLHQGYVPLKSVNRILGYAEQHVFFGFGPQSCGFKKITPTEYVSLLRLLSNHESK